MPVFSLPGEYGIGTFGKESYAFIDFLSASGQKVWQMLPIGQTTFGDSPYQTTADASFNPYFCDLDDLYNKGLITEKELSSAKSGVRKVDYGRLYKKRYKLLRKAFSRYTFDDEFLSCVNSKKYRDYAAFMALKSIYGDLSHFPDDLKRRDKRALTKFLSENEEEYLFNIFVQFTLEKQFFALKKYAAERGIKLMGDLPLYVAYDSADVWAHPEAFMLDENFTPTEVAGVPPDYFSEEGQLWGNPLYNYEKMQKTGYAFWRKRIRLALSRYDLLRIDHFRGLDRFWAIPSGRPAKEGKWLPSDGAQILKPFKNRLIAEDLGVIDDGVRELLKKTGYPGMKVLLFAFDGNGENPYLPRNIENKSVCYVGTHDNDCANGYAKKLNGEDFARFKKRVNEVLPPNAKKLKKRKDTASVLTETAYSTKSELVIISFADAAELDDKYRINTPSTVGNWTTRFTKQLFSEELSSRLLALTKKYRR